MEKLIIIAVIVIASLVHSWIQKKQEEAAAKESGPPPDPSRRRDPRTGPDRPAPSSRPSTSRGGTDWETELRRLLGGEVAAPRPQPTPAPPPLPPPTQAARGRVKGKAAPAAPPPVLARSSIPVPDEGMEMEAGMPVNLTQASSAHNRAQIQGGVAQRMHDTLVRVSEHEGGPGGAKTARTARIARTARKAKMAVELGAALPLQRSAGVRRLLRDRESQRTAVLASIILGPPRSLENRHEI